MRKLIFMIGAVLLLVSTASTMPEPSPAPGVPHIVDTEWMNEEVLVVDAVIDSHGVHQYTVFEEAGKLQYLARSSGHRTEDGEYERVTEYANTSLDDWVADRLRFASSLAVRDAVDDTYDDPDGIRTRCGEDTTDSSDGAVCITYLEYEHSEPDRPFTYDELDDFLPSQINTALHVYNYTASAQHPVQLHTEPAPEPFPDLGEPVEPEPDDRSLVERVISALRSLVPF